MKTNLLIICMIFIFSASQSLAQTTDSETIPKKKYFTKKVEGAVPSIDGKLDDPAWDQVEWGGDFIQRQPYENEAPTQKTAFKILYDQKNLYIGYRCYDTEPDKIVKRMSRRDGFEGDWVEINIDSYHDLRTAFSFTISASGVKGDEFISNDGNNWDGSWDPIWYVKTSVDEQGWIAELRIPLSQLRFANKEEHVWGIQFTRRDFRKEERSVWQFIPRNANTWVSSFGELHGLTGIKPQKQLEIQPFLLAQTESYQKEEGNPFATGSDRSFNLGLDGKIGVTSDLTIDFTINPDFGQVEADPSALALDGFQIFFQERRPFFIEGRNIFNYRLTGSAAGGPFESDRLFYSRRIGGAPSGYPDIANDEYMTMPTNTTILGAAKFTGKTSNGMSIGIMESVTEKEYAEIDRSGERRKEVVEPLSNYFVGRLQQDYNEGNTVIGGMFTAVNRDLKDNTNFEFLHRSAYSSGLDFLHRWKNQSWQVQGNLVMSKVNGSKEAILNTQQSFEHNFQRTDADHLEVDTSLTSLTGHSGTVKLGRFGGGKNFMFEAGVTWRSPELELNDIGFLRSTDEITHFAWAGYRINKPFSIFRRMGFNYNHWQSWDFSGLHTFAGWNVNMNATFKNNSFFNTGSNIIPFELSSKALRGGPMLNLGKRINNWVNYGTDERKKVRFFVNLWHQWYFDSPTRARSYYMELSYQPMNTLQISIGPGLSINKNVLQYVQNVETEKGVRYVNATIDQKTFDMTLRLNYTINPNLTIQYYGSPFISRGRYSEFKHVNDPLNDNFHQRYVAYSDEQISHDEDTDSYIIDENNDGEDVYSIGNPDFNFMQFRSNLVLRWEYIPGSEIYLVWSQGNTNSGDPADRLLPSLQDNLFSEKAHNIFLLKYTYRFIK